MPKARKAIARFQSPIGAPVIDEENGIIRCCRIATLGSVSSSAAEDGGGMVMDSRMIAGLLKEAKDNGDRVPAFFAHDWSDETNKADPIHSDAGVWNEFSIDGEGNLTATFTAFDTPYKAGIFSRARKDPRGIAISPIFHYKQRNGDKRFCDPVDFVSGDFVKFGAINKALFQEDQTQNNSMDIQELLVALQDPQVLEALKAVIKSVEAAQPAEPDTAPIEGDAGVLAEDKKPDDDKLPALMRAQVRIARATSRNIKLLATNESALIEKATVAAEAKFVGRLGHVKFVPNHGNNGNDDFEAAITAQMSAGAANRGVAIARLAKDKPEIYNAARTSGKI